MLSFKDQLNRSVELKNTPKRIISLVPSQTELLYDLGLENDLIGITKFCIHPNEWFRSKSKIGGTKSVNFAKIAALNPDLIIANKEENNKEPIDYLMKHYPVWISDIKTIKDALNMIETIGEITTKKGKAIEIINQIKLGFQSINKFNRDNNKVAYFIWDKPIMVAGSTTFIDDVLQHCGFENIFSKEHLKNTNTNSYRYPEISEKQLQEATPDYIFLSSEPYPFKEKHIQYFKLLCPESIVKTVDGELFSWYGSRLILSSKYLSALISELSV